MTLYIHMLACAFGLGSWVAINGMWVELPLIVNILPEGWVLPSYLTVIIQLANLGPLLVTLVHKLCPGRLRENLVIYLVLILGAVACVLLTVFWRKTTVILGELRSTLPAKYITTYFIGEGLMDNLSHSDNESFALETQYLPPNFSTEVFFSFLSAMMVVSLGAFAMLDWVPRTFEISTEHLVPEPGAVISVCGGVENPAASNLTTKSQEDDERSWLRPLVVKPFYTTRELTFVYFMVVWANGATNGLLPSVQTFSCMPYGNLAYHLSAALASVANPLACIIAMLAPKRSLVFLGVLCLLGTGFGGYNMAMAAMSPCPLLQDAPAGQAAIVLSWVFFMGLLSYVKVMVGVILRDQSHTALVWCGAAAQTGSMVGSIIMFPLVNVYNLFKSGDICSRKCPL
uniref:Riboflavin transporter n=1 Tax=Electrophorus electricus TaxID=8005 RepID=A0A4W4DR80_ELEEL